MQAYMCVSGCTHTHTDTHRHTHIYIYRERDRGGRKRWGSAQGVIVFGNGPKFKILDEIVYISHNTNFFRKYMDPTISSSMGK